MRPTYGLKTTYAYVLESRAFVEFERGIWSFFDKSLKCQLNPYDIEVQ